MKILNKRTETAESLVAKAKRNILKDLRDLSNNRSELYEQFRELNPDLSQAVKNYCTIYKKLEKIESEGLLQEFSVASKNLISSFRFTDNAKDSEFIHDNFVSINDSPLYKAMEAIFDVSLFKEEGKARLFTNVYNMQKTIGKVEEDGFMFYVKPYFYYVNATCGVILRKTDLKVYDFDPEKFITDISGYAYYDGQFLESPFGGLCGTWENATYNKQSGDVNSGVIYKYVRFGKDETGKVFYMPAHHIIALCWYGINVIKFCLGSGSLLTVDHRDDNPFSNSIFNLAILTRVDNVKKAKKGEKGINFIMFFEVLGIGSSPFSYRW